MAEVFERRYGFVNRRLLVSQLSHMSRSTPLLDVFCRNLELAFGRNRFTGVIVEDFEIGFGVEKG